MFKRAATGPLKTLAKGFPIVAITGPRQSGKTTLAQAVFKHKKYVSLEDSEQLAFATEDPKGFLAALPTGAVIDEVQKCPLLFSALQVRVDLDKKMGSFILTGSQQFGLSSHISQSLAGRVGHIQLLPFSIGELKKAKIKRTPLLKTLWRGFYPPLFDRPVTPQNWYGNYIRTYIERDVRQIIQVKDLSLFQRFLKMCAARNSQLLNTVELGNSCGISHATVQNWISVLEASYLIFLLRPHHRNFGKRLVKHPKLYFFDSGLVCHLLQIQNEEHLTVHPSRGAIFESYVISEFIKNRFNHGLDSNLSFWRDHVGQEIDLIQEEGSHLTPIEIKSGQTLTSEWITTLKKWLALSKNKADKAYLIYGGDMTRKQQGIYIHSWRSLPLKE